MSGAGESEKSNLVKAEDSHKALRTEANYKLRCLQSRLAAEFDFLKRETVQLCQKRFLKPDIDSIDLTEGELKFLKVSKERKLREIVSRNCSSTIRFLMSQKYVSYPFNEPVNTEMYRDYLNFVETPMDFGTIKKKLGQYKTPWEFEQDVRLVFENARKYNAPETEVREMARILEQRFEEKWNKSVVPRIAELKAHEVDEHIAFKQSKADTVTTEAESRVEECCRLLLGRLQVAYPPLPTIRLCKAYSSDDLASSQCGFVSKEAQVRLAWELITLPAEHFQRAANLILTRHPGLVATMRNSASVGGQSTIELDLEKIDGLTFWILKDFVRQCLKDVVDEDQSGNENDDNEALHDQKRLKRSKSPHDRVATSDYLSTSRQEIHWPGVPYGIGLKSYEQETQAFIPITIDDQSLPFSVFFNNRREPSLEEEIKKTTLPSNENKMTETETPADKKRILHKTPQSHSATLRKTHETEDSKPSMLLLPHSIVTKTHTERDEIDVISSVVPATISELRPPTVLVSSEGIAAIPLVPDAQSTAQFSSFFTASLQPVTGLMEMNPIVATRDMCSVSIPPPMTRILTPNLPVTSPIDKDLE